MRLSRERINKGLQSSSQMKMGVLYAFFVGTERTDKHRTSTLTLQVMPACLRRLLQFPLLLSRL